jgi:2-dehydro-3-deoxyphosphogalactonate aldolase
MTFDDAFEKLPLVAIIRGVRPDEAEAIGEAIVGAGFTLIEVPLNSPDPLASIATLVRSLDGRAVVGAGTVLTPDAVDEVQATGASIVVSPNMNPAVIARAAEHGLASLPGISTPTEAFAALDAGAAALKLFPAEGSSPAVLKAMRAVLPKTTRVLPVGGINPDNMTPWIAAGADGFGLASALYKPGDAPDTVAANARRFVENWRAARAG